MLSVEHITTGYGKKQVLTDISFEVGEREIILLTGGNGSGKSTVLKTIYGLLKPWTPEGRILFAGQDITALPTEALIRLGIVYMPQKKNVFEDFTVEENLLASASIYSKTEVKQRLTRVFDIVPRLAELQKETPFHLSGGERQLLALGNVMVHTPKLMLLDEPFAGLDASGTTVINEQINHLQASTAFLIAEHRQLSLGTLANRIRNIELTQGTIKR